MCLIADSRASIGSSRRTSPGASLASICWGNTSSSLDTIFKIFFYFIFVGNKIVQSMCVNNLHWFADGWGSLHHLVSQRAVSVPLQFIWTLHQLLLHSSGVDSRHSTFLFNMVMSDYIICYHISIKRWALLQVIGSPEEASRLLLCEATAIVMRKCFHLLGITPVYKIWYVTVTF